MYLNGEWHQNFILLLKRCISFTASLSVSPRSPALVSQLRFWIGRGRGRLSSLRCRSSPVKMDEDSDSSPKAALLGGAMKRGGSGRRGRLSRRYSVNSLRSEFISRLPEKVRSRLHDVESPYEVDLSKSTGFSRGYFLSLTVYRSLSLSLYCSSISFWLLREWRW